MKTGTASKGWVAVLTLTSLLMVVFSGSISAQTQPPRTQFAATVLVGNLKDPTSIAFLPDGRLYLLQKNGTLQIVDPKTKQATAAGKLPSSDVREDGLHSLVVDPNFATNHFVYILFSVTSPSQAMIVARFTTQETGALDMASRKDMLTVPYSITSGNEHTTGYLAFGPDGNLFVSLADNTSNIFSGTGAGYAPRDPSRLDYDAQRSAANSNDLRGKILRIHPEADGTYTIPEGNLFPPGKAKTKPEIYVMGLRHPFRITVDAKTGWLFWAEPGPNATRDDANIGPRGYEEVNLAQTPGNYGWPYCLGNNFCNKEFDYATAKGGATYDPAHLVNLSKNNTGIDTLPPARPALVWYPYNAQNSDFPTFGNGSTDASMLGPVYRFDGANTSTTKFPLYFDGRLFIFDFQRSLIHTVKVDADGKLVSVDKFWDQTTSNPILNPIDAKFGPDGALYFLGWGDNGNYPHNSSHGNLVRLDYTGPADGILSGATHGSSSHGLPIHWSLLPPGATWSPPARIAKAEAFDLQGRIIWVWKKGMQAPTYRSSVLLRLHLTANLAE